MLKNILFSSVSLMVVLGLWSGLSYADVGPEAPHFDSTSSEPVLLRYKLQQGQDYGFDINVNTDIDMDNAGQTMSIPIAMDFAGLYSVESVMDNGDASLSLSFSRITMESGGPAPVSYDSDDEGEDVHPAMQYLSILAENPMDAVVTPQGEVKDVDMHLLVDAMRQAGATAMIESLEQTADQNFRGAFVQLPTDSVRAGDTYEAGEVIQPMPGIGEMRTQISYTIMSVSADQSLVLLEPHAELTIDAAENAEVSIDINSYDMSGWVLFDNEQGNITSSFVTVTFAMDMVQGGQEVSMQTTTAMGYQCSER